MFTMFSSFYRDFGMSRRKKKHSNVIYVMYIYNLNTKVFLMFYESYSFSNDSI